MRRRTQLRTSPGGPVAHVIGTRTEFGSHRVLHVVRVRGEWLEVLASERKNRSGWIPRSSVELGATDWSIVVDRSARRLRVLRGDRTVRRLPVAVGRAGNETPLGRFAVTDLLTTADPSSPYGCCAIALTGRQPKLVPGWPGGDRLAIHATPAVESIGQAASLGCLRATTRDLRVMMRRVPLGAPVFVRA